MTAMKAMEQAMKKAMEKAAAPAPQAMKKCGRSCLSMVGRLID